MSTGAIAHCNPTTVTKFVTTNVMAAQAATHDNLPRALQQ
jgi:hypothetical protein